MYTYFSRFLHHTLSYSGLTRISRWNKFANYCDLDTPVKPECDSLYAGRSMVEMLGVLAIIGVLSVGAIAGYSKAMEKWKINKNITGYNHLIFGLMEYYNELSSLPPDKDDVESKHYLTKTINKLNLLPESWKYDKSKSQIYDFLNNSVSIFARRKSLVFDIILSKSNSSNYTTKICTELISSLAKPLAYDINYLYIWPSNVGYFYGDKYCGGDKTCLSRTTLTQIERACSSCVENPNDFCTLVFEF